MEEQILCRKSKSWFTPVREGSGQKLFQKHFPVQPPETAALKAVVVHTKGTVSEIFPQGPKDKQPFPSLPEAVPPARTPSESRSSSAHQLRTSSSAPTQHMITKKIARRLRILWLFNRGTTTLPVFFRTRKRLRQNPPTPSN